MPPCHRIAENGLRHQSQTNPNGYNHRVGRLCGMRCKLTLIEVLVLTGVIAFILGLVTGLTNALQSRFQLSPWLAFPVAIVIVGVPLSIVVWASHRLDQRLMRRIESKMHDDPNGSEDS